MIFIFLSTEIPPVIFVLALGRPLRHAGQVADDARSVIQIFTAALRALLQLVLADISAVVADGVGHIKSEVGAAFMNRVEDQQFILAGGKVLFEVDMAGAAAVEVADIAIAMKSNLIENRCLRIFDDEKIAVITCPRNGKTVRFIPFGILYAQAFCHSVTLMTNLFLVFISFNEISPCLSCLIKC